MLSLVSLPRPLHEGHGHTAHAPALCLRLEPRDEVGVALPRGAGLDRTLESVDLARQTADLLQHSVPLGGTLLKLLHDGSQPIPDDADVLHARDLLREPIRLAMARQDPERLASP
jgi:hypothetical protein